MSEPNSTEQIYAVLIGLRNDTLLLPNAGVVEVTSREGLKTLPDTPVWFAGMLDWQGTQLPVIRFEALAGTAADSTGRRARVAVVNGVSHALPGGRFGVLCEGYPHLVTLSRAALRPAAAREQDRAEFVLARVRVASTEAAIPNLQRIEQELAQLLATASV
ncbi:MAG: chemotaxis protein CheW [Nevskia sp.]|nr:chemotaxis protein CheW [Nevskia sp.]